MKNLDPKIAIFVIALILSGVLFVVSPGFLGASIISTNTITAGAGSSNGTITTSGNYDLILQTGNATTSLIQITDGPNGNIWLSTNGTGDVLVGDGNSGGTLKSAGNNDIIISTGSASTSNITIGNGSNGNITANMNGTGETRVLGSIAGDGSTHELLASVLTLSSGNQSEFASAMDGNFTVTGSAIQSTEDIAAIDGNMQWNSTGTANELNGMSGFVRIGSVANGTITTAQGTTGGYQHDGTGTVTSANLVRAYAELGGAGTTNSLTLFSGDFSDESGATHAIGMMRGLNIPALTYNTGTGTVGIDVGAISGSSGFNYAIRTSGGELNHLWSLAGGNTERRHINSRLTLTSGTQSVFASAIDGNLTVSGSAAQSSEDIAAIDGRTLWSSTGAANEMSGTSGFVEIGNVANGTITSALGVSGGFDHTGTGTVTTASVVRSYAHFTTTGTTTNLIFFDAEIDDESEGTHNNPTIKGVNIPAISIAETLAVGVDIGNISGATNNYSIRTGSGIVQFGGRVDHKKGPDITSTGNITLPTTGNSFDITGSTTINTISAPSQAGTTIILQFDASVTVKHATAGTGAQLNLAGAADFSATAGDTLMLWYDGAVWREVARTAI